MSDTFTIAAVQMKIAPDRDTNLANAERAIAEAARRGAQVVCLPELFTGYYVGQLSWLDRSERVLHAQEFCRRGGC